MGGTDRMVARECKGARSLKGFSIEGAVAQDEPRVLDEKVAEWLKSIGI